MRNALGFCSDLLKSVSASGIWAYLAFTAPSFHAAWTGLTGNQLQLHNNEAVHIYRTVVFKKAAKGVGPASLSALANCVFVCFESRITGLNVRVIMRRILL